MALVPRPKTAKILAKTGLFLERHHCRHQGSASIAQVRVGLVVVRFRMRTHNPLVGGSNPSGPIAVFSRIQAATRDGVASCAPVESAKRGHVYRLRGELNGTNIGTSRHHCRHLELRPRRRKVPRSLRFHGLVFCHWAYQLLASSLAGQVNQFKRNAQNITSERRREHSFGSCCVHYIRHPISNESVDRRCDLIHKCRDYVAILPLASSFKYPVVELRRPRYTPPIVAPRIKKSGETKPIAPA